MHVALPYTKEAVQAAFANVIQLATDQAEQNKMHGFECADDIISEESIVIVQYVKNMIDNTPDDAPNLSK